MREITDEVKKVIIGKDEVVDMVFAAILAQGKRQKGAFGKDRREDKKAS